MIRIRKLRTKRLVLALILMFLVGLFSLKTAVSYAQSQPTAAFEPAECWFEPSLAFLPNQEFECGYVTVPERHADPEGPTIKLPVAILRALGENPQPDPLFLAQGGPGGDAFEIFPITMPNSNVRLERDLVIFNQRGANYAQPDLRCTEIFDAAVETLALEGSEADSLSIEALQACYERLQAQGIDLSAFNSLENAADVDTIRAALGYDTINFYGVSYGTLLGFHLMQNHPENLRSVILDGVVPTNLNFIPQVTANIDRVFTELIQTCLQDADCNAAYPELENRFFDLVDALNTEPVHIKVRDPETGRSVTAFLDGDTLVDVLFQAFYLPDAYATFPKLVSNLEAGDYTFIGAIWPLIAFDRTQSDGMYFSVICAEDADFSVEDANIEGVRPYFAANAQNDLQDYLDICEFWQVDLLPATVDDPVTSEVPALLLSGYYDPITPPNFAAAAADSLPNVYSFTSPTGSHGVAFSDPCIDSIIDQFLAAPMLEPNGACLTAIEPAAFVPPDALSFPFLGEVNQLSTSMWWQLGIAGLFLLGILTAFVVLPVAALIVLLQQKEVTPETAVPNDQPTKRARNLKWIGGLLVLLFGVLALLFIGTAAFFTLEALFSGLASIFAVSGAAAPFFVIPLILLVIAIVLIGITVFAWRKRAWPTWARLYFTFLTICSVGYVAVLAYGGMLTVLF